MHQDCSDFWEFCAPGTPEYGRQPPPSQSISWPLMKNGLISCHFHPASGGFDRAGHGEIQITQAKSSREAAELIASKMFDLAIVDTVISYYNDVPDAGFRVMRQLRDEQPECRIIAMSGRVSDREGERALEAGASSFFTAAWGQIEPVSYLRQRVSIWVDLLALHRAELFATAPEASESVLHAAAMVEAELVEYGRRNSQQLSEMTPLRFEQLIRPSLKAVGFDLREDLAER